MRFAETASAMEFIRGLPNLKPRHRGCAATIGNFDGVHRGHQAVIAHLVERARGLGLPAVAVIFEPQPQEFFQGAAAPARLTRLREKLQALNEAGLDRVLCVRFDARLAALDPTEFIERVLVNGLGIRYLAVGDDFRFGRGRAGDYASLEQAGRVYGFTVEPTPTFRNGGARVSSTLVREALAVGDLERARTLLGHAYCISGRVAHGDKRGRTIGVPTANIHLHRRVVPLKGVYAVTASGVGDSPIAGVANIGTRPTVDGTRALLEVHLFDFDREIYGAHLDIDFLHKLRDERRFDSFEELKQQIARDINEAREWSRGQRRQA